MLLCKGERNLITQKNEDVNSLEYDHLNDRRTLLWRNFLQFINQQVFTQTSFLCKDVVLPMISD